MPGVSRKNVLAVRVFQVVICHAACENHGFYGGLVTPFPAFSGVFPFFGLRAGKFQAGFFRVLLFFVPTRRASLPFPFTHAPMCAYTRPREIHNVVPFPFLFESIKKCSPTTVLFTMIYRKSSKNLQKSIA